MDSIVLESQRDLRVSTAEARLAVVRVLRAQEFTLTSEQVSIVTAKRGSQVIGSVQPKKLPVVLKATFQPTPSDCTVMFRLSDTWRTAGVGKVWGMNGPYRGMMGDIQMALDEALAPLGLDDAPFAEGNVTTATGDVALLSASNGAFGRAGGAIADKADALITPSTAMITPKKLEEIALHSSKGVASFSRMEVEGLFSVGLLVSSK
ncbi:MAG TPA: hypothetical protein VGM78_16510, partial [Ilumatobacteraceae bacterium]